MDDPGVSSRMREDWNERAREDATYYVALGRRNQDEAEFFSTATEVINGLEFELQRVPLAQRGNWRALEIGCGPGRLMRPMSRHFVRIDGVDVSDEMIGLAREKLKDVPNAFVHLTDGANLTEFDDNLFDFVYSYAVFQHIPSPEVVLRYLQETRRVLRTGGLTRMQFNGLPRTSGVVDTWAGARFASKEILEFAQNLDFQVLELEGVATQYMWTTWRKQAQGWQLEQEDRHPEGVRIRRITNASGPEPVAPCRGRFACISIWMENLPAEAGLHHLQVTVGDSLGFVSYVGPQDRAGQQQVNVQLPELEATGLLPVNVLWLGRLISPPATLRVIPPGPSVPRIMSVCDGVNLSSTNRIENRLVKITLEEIARPYDLEATVGGHSVSDLELFCIDPKPQRFEANFRLPEEIGPGSYPLELRIGRRKLRPVTLQVTA